MSRVDIDLEFWSEDHKFGLVIAISKLRRILRLCVAAAPNETGGILAGYYTNNSDCAIVSSISGVPQDSQRGRNWFYRGISGLQDWLDQMWAQEHHYYLGEWHFHPFGQPTPSKKDIEQMTSIAFTPSYHCPEPVLLLLGGNPTSFSQTEDIRAYVFPKGRKHLELLLSSRRAS